MTAVVESYIIYGIESMSDYDIDRGLQQTTPWLAHYCMPNTALAASIALSTNPTVSYRPLVSRITYSLSRPLLAEGCLLQPL